MLHYFLPATRNDVRADVVVGYHRRLTSILFFIFSIFLYFYVIYIDFYARANLEYKIKWISNMDLL